jgi:RNA polymerase sigma-70 factor (ECF subfamily)
MPVRLDSQLLAASAHDPTAFRELYERYAQSIHGFCLKRTRDHEAALDLTAETLAQAWQSRDRFTDQHDGSVGPWLFGIARNLLRRAVRDGRLADEARGRLQLSHERTVVSPHDGWLDGLDTDLEAAVSALPDNQRRAIELRVLHDQPYQRVADQLDCSPVAARIRVSRGLAAIRTSLTSTDSKEIST